MGWWGCYSCIHMCTFQWPADDEKNKWISLIFIFVGLKGGCKSVSGEWSSDVSDDPLNWQKWFSALELLIVDFQNGSWAIAAGLHLKMNPLMYLSVWVHQIKWCWTIWGIHNGPSWAWSHGYIEEIRGCPVKCGCLLGLNWFDSMVLRQTSMMGKVVVPWMEELE